MSRTYDALRLRSSMWSKPERIPRPIIIPAAPSAEAREDQWERLTAHYHEHQSGEMLVLLRGGYSEMVTTQQCPDCLRYGRAFDQYQAGRGISDVVMEVWE